MPSIPASFLSDAKIVGALLFLGLSSMLLAYQIGRPSWTFAFRIRTTGQDGRRQHYPGQYGEIVLTCLAAAIVLIVSAIMPDATLSYLMRVVWPWTPLVLVILLAGTAIYGNETSAKMARDYAAARKAPNNRRAVQYLNRLERGYRTYAIYSTVNFSFALMMLGLVTLQFDADMARYVAHRTEVEALLAKLPSHSASNSDAFQTLVEAIYGTTVLAAARAVGVVNSFLVVLIVALAVNIALNFTALRRIYQPKAVQTTNLLAIVAAVIVFVAGWIIYRNGYVSLLADVDAALKLTRPATFDASWQVSQRFHAILVDLGQRQGFNGFLLAIANERGGLLLLLGLLQFLLVARREFGNAWSRKLPGSTPGGAA